MDNEKRNILDVKGLYPAGGYANDPTVSEAIETQKQRWAALTPEERKEADEAWLARYPRTSNQDGR